MDTIVIGSGFAGLSAACYMAKAGHSVTVLEKNNQPGGRAQSFEEKGFTFDMGPSWYWMPDVFEKFFADFNKKPSDYYQLVRLDPSYLVFTESDVVPIPANFQELIKLFESIEKGAGSQLEAFMKEATTKYEISMGQLVRKPGLSITEFVRADVLSSIFKMDLFKSIKTHARKYFQHPLLLQLVEFPILFLGALPANTPALYTLMNHADMKGGTWYPLGGMVGVVKGFYMLAKSLGVNFEFSAPVESFSFEGKNITAVHTPDDSYAAEVVINTADYHHIDQQLLPAAFRHYDSTYWEKRKMAPSCLIYFIGLSTKVPRLEHHNLFFDTDFDAHAAALYTDPCWPTDPLMYVCCTSKTDEQTAPHGCENLFVLIPTAPGLLETEDTRTIYLEKVWERLASRTGKDLKPFLSFCRSFAGKDFVSEYNAFRGNAYGLANTLTQTAVLKPKIKNKKLNNLYYAGQLTVPGPGVPPAILSGEIVAKFVTNAHRNTKKSLAL